MDVNVVDGLVSEQRQQELSFCAASLVNPTEAVLQCAWLDPVLFVDEKLRGFWSSLLETKGDASKASVEIGLELDLLEHSTRLLAPVRPELYAQKISELSYYTRLIRQSSRIVQAVIGREQESIEKQIHELSSITMLGSTDITLEDAHDEFVASLYDPERSIRTGFGDIDARIGGLFPQECSILAGMPGSGKTAFTGHLALNIARSKHRVLYCSLEMPRKQLWARLACGETNYSWQDVRTGKIPPGSPELVEIDQKASELLDEVSPYFLIDDQCFSVSAIHARCNRFDPEVVIIDNLGEIAKPAGDEEVHFYDQAITYLRTNVARKDNRHVIILHHIKRAVDDRKDKRPLMSDLSWSSALEKKADLIMFSYLDILYNPIPGINKVPWELIVRKNRQGNSNFAVALMYDLLKQRFFQLSKQEFSVNKPRRDVE